MTYPLAKYSTKVALVNASCQAVQSKTAHWKRSLRSSTRCPPGHEGNPDRYERAEGRTINYLLINRDSLSQEIVITDAEARAVYGPEDDPKKDPAYYDDYPSRGTPADQGAWAVRRDDQDRKTEAASKVAKKSKRRGKSKAATTDSAPAEKTKVRPGTKQALLIDLLRRPEGATVEQIAEATGWQHHTIRGAISGALKKKLGLTVEATRTREVGPNKTGAKGSTTVYRIVA